MRALPMHTSPAALVLALGLALMFSAGCGTTRWTDTSRTATEQLLVSDAIDRAVDQIDFSILSGQDVYLNTEHVDAVTDKGYVIGALRQKLLASGCVLKSDQAEAKYVVEPRIGAVGTDRHELLYGVPATNVGSVMTIPGVPSSIPEIPIVKRTDQIGVAKIAVFAYLRETGSPVWQSAVARELSSAKDFWVLGAGPFQNGTIYDGTAFAGQEISSPLNGLASGSSASPAVSLTQEATFQPLLPQIASAPQLPTTEEVQPVAAPGEDPGQVRLSALPNAAAAHASGGAPFAPPGTAIYPAGDGQPGSVGYTYPATDRLTPGAAW